MITPLIKVKDSPWNSLYNILVGYFLSDIFNNLGASFIGAIFSFSFFFFFLICLSQHCFFGKSQSTLWRFWNFCTPFYLSIINKKLCLLLHKRKMNVECILYTMQSYSSQRSTFTAWYNWCIPSLLWRLLHC